MTLDEARAHVGHGVVYRPMVGPAEDGVITSVSSLMAFVLFKGDLHAKATRPGDLELLAATAAGTENSDGKRA
jgi:hypothetical protein